MSVSELNEIRMTMIQDQSMTISPVRCKRKKFRESYQLGMNRVDVKKNRYKETLIKAWTKKKK